MLGALGCRPWTGWKKQDSKPALPAARPGCFHYRAPGSGFEFGLHLLLGCVNLGSFPLSLSVLACKVGIK